MSPLAASIEVMETIVAIATAIGAIAGATYGVIRLADRVRVVDRFSTWRRRRHARPARTYSAVTQRRSSARRFVSAPNAYATTPFARKRLERYLRDGIPTRRAGDSEQR
jgi:hypothetical protein